MLKGYSTVNNQIIEAVLSKEKMKELALSKEYDPENYVLISIQDPGDPDNLELYRNKFKDNVSLRFWDIEEDLGVKSNGIPIVPINNEEADKVIDFILKHKEERFFIHCAAGQSRSAGTALAVETIIKFDGQKYIAGQFPSDIKLMPQYSPNYVVYDKIIERFIDRGLVIDKRYTCHHCKCTFDKYISGFKNGINTKICPICYEEQK